MIGIGNSIALLALLGWPFVAIALFRLLPVERALIWSILGAYMFMPQLSAIDLPVVPALDKETIPNLMAFALVVGTFGMRPDLLPTGAMGRMLLLLFIVSPAVTVINNLDPIFFGVDQFGSLTVVDHNALQRWGLPGLRIYDSLSALALQIFLMLPFFVARMVLRDEDALREIIAALLVAACLYAPLMLIEIRISPQLHTMLYGFFQHDFIQAMRAGGFRPFVFMPHGLWVAFFAFTCAMAAAVWLRMAPVGQKFKRLMFLGFCILLVVICKSWGPLVFTVLFVPIVLFLSVRKQLLIAAALASAVLTYPIVRGSGIIPTEQLIARLYEVNAERAQSLEYRFTNEDRILTHTADRPLFGWGGWGRFMTYESATGEEISIVDGQWVITIGHYGWLGYIAMFGLLALPIWTLWWHARKPGAPPVPVHVSGLALILAVNLVDLLPNATLIPFTWLIAGALLGYAETLKERTRTAQIEALRVLRQGTHLGIARDEPRTRLDTNVKTTRRTAL